METDKDILETYKETIEKDIEALLLEQKITDARKKDSFAQRYRENFVKGFREGVPIGKKKLQEEKLKMAKNLLEFGAGIHVVAKATGLSLEELRNL